MKPSHHNRVKPTIFVTTKPHTKTIQPLKEQNFVWQQPIQSFSLTALTKKTTLSTHVWLRLHSIALLAWPGLKLVRCTFGTIGIFVLGTVFIKLPEHNSVAYETGIMWYICGKTWISFTLSSLSERCSALSIHFLVHTVTMLFLEKIISLKSEVIIWSLIARLLVLI